MMLGHRCVASDHVLLDDDAAPHGFDRTIENRNKSVAGGFDEPSVMPCNAGLYEVALDPLHANVRSFFIDFHEPAVARDIATTIAARRRDDFRGGSPLLLDFSSRISPMARIWVSHTANGSARGGNDSSRKI